MIRRCLLLLLAGLLLCGCVSVPDHGQVQAGPTPDSAAQVDAPFDFTPSGPAPGDTPVEIVSGFLLAMQATPVSTAVARKFLTSEGSTGWKPESRTVVYGSQTLPTAGSVVTVELADTVELDRRGEWLGDTRNGRGTSYRLQLVREKGEWRISNPPDALLVPETHFESRFQQYFLYFFDRSAQVLVPEPVYLPRGEQTPTLLLRGLLQGPDRELLGVTRTFIPAGTDYDLSVPVSRDGVAEVPLTDEVLELSQDALDLAMAQIAWTLKQVPGIRSMRLTVDGSPLEIPGEGAERDVQGWPEYDPTVNWASEELFGLRDGRVVTILDDDERRIAGLFGSEDYGLRSIAVDLPGEQVAGVVEDGTSAVVAPRGRNTGEVPTAGDVVPVFTGGTDLLRPAWDIYGQVWLVDRTTAGAEVTVVRAGTPSTFTVPGVSGEQVKAFLVSRDGTRFVAVVAGRDGDRLLVARVLHADDGTVRRVAAATDLPVGAFDVDEIRDIAWRTPGSIALLAGPTPGLSQVIVARIDGSSALGDVATNAEIFRDEAVRIVTSPATGAPLYVGTSNGQLFELAANGRWTGTSIKGGLQSPTFVG